MGRQVEDELGHVVVIMVSCCSEADAYVSFSYHAESTALWLGSQRERLLFLFNYNQSKSARVCFAPFSWCFWQHHGETDA
jgi:hypothetical protein